MRREVARRRMGMHGRLRHTGARIVIPGPPQNQRLYHEASCIALSAPCRAQTTSRLTARRHECAALLLLTCVESAQAPAKLTSLNHMQTCRTAFQHAKLDLVPNWVSKQCYGGIYSAELQHAMAYSGRIRQLQGGTTDGSTHLDCPWPVKYSGASMGVID